MSPWFTSARVAVERCEVCRAVRSSSTCSPHNHFFIPHFSELNYSSIIDFIHVVLLQLPIILFPPQHPLVTIYATSPCPSPLSLLVLIPPPTLTICHTSLPYGQPSLGLVCSNMHVKVDLITKEGCGERKGVSKWTRRVRHWDCRANNHSIFLSNDKHW